MDARSAGGWAWPATEDNPWTRAGGPLGSGSGGSGGPQARAAGSQAEPDAPQPEQAPEREPTPPRRERRHRPRTCRICLDVVEPTIVDEPDGIGAFLRRKPRVKYESTEEDGGRLFSPCKCKGSQKYVHEGCLQAWRNAGPRNDRNSWKCPTCAFEYKLERLVWGRMLSRPLVRVSLTLAILVLTVFLLGFVGDTIINLWLDPFGTIQDTVMGDGGIPLPAYEDDEEGDWLDHFLKGFLSLGLLGFVKTLWTMNPIYYWMNRGRGRRRGGGRDRIEGLNLAIVIIGVFTFLGVCAPPALPPLRSSETTANPTRSWFGEFLTMSPIASLVRSATESSTFKGRTTRTKTKKSSSQTHPSPERTNEYQYRYPHLTAATRHSSCPRPGEALI